MYVALQKVCNNHVLTFSLFFRWKETKKSSAQSRGQEIPVVPPQFTPCGASWDPNRSAGCIGPFPSPPTVSFSEAAPKGIPRRRFRCLAPTGSSLSKREWHVLVFITAFNMCFLVYHFTLRKSITKTEKIYKIATRVLWEMLKQTVFCKRSEHRCSLEKKLRGV